MKKLRVVDLFAGGGGLSLGFSNAGFNIVAAFDNWTPACELYRLNFSSHPMVQADLGSKDVIEKIKAYSPDIIIGGPPCQDFSSAGKRDESLGRANLTLNYANIIASVKPSYFVMENVNRAVKSRVFAAALKVFQKAGYGVTIKILDASLCGVPQQRKRVFVVGERSGKKDFLLPSLETYLAEKPLTIKEYFGDKLNIKHYYRHPRSYKRRAVFSVDAPSPTIRGVNRPIPKGYPGHQGDAVSVNSKIRPLTTRERSMVQSFPETYVLTGNKTHVEQIIGNAVPVKLAEYVALRLKEYVTSKVVSKKTKGVGKTGKTSHAKVVTLRR